MDLASSYLREVHAMKHLARLLAVLWLTAALSLVGWLIVNLDAAGWILIVLTTGLMTFELTRRPARTGGTGRRAEPHELPDERGGP
jgi:hypothetical protein